LATFRAFKATSAVLLCGAGKFTLRGSCVGPADGLLTAEQQAISDWLRRETRGELRLTLGWADMVGPWNVMVDFAGAMRHWFAEEFREEELTLRASLELMKPKRPIKPAVERADRRQRDSLGVRSVRAAALAGWRDTLLRADTRAG
jgi:hypothetical protein